MGIAEPVTHRTWHPSVRAAAKITNVLDIVVRRNVSLLLLLDTLLLTRLDLGVFDVPHKRVYYV